MFATTTKAVALIVKVALHRQNGITINLPFPAKQDKSL